MASLFKAIFEEHSIQEVWQHGVSLGPREEKLVAVATVSSRPLLHPLLEISTESRLEAALTHH